VARLAASSLLANVRTGAYGNIGVGFSEEVCRVIFETGRLGDLTFIVESGVLGGLPAAGHLLRRSALSRAHPVLGGGVQAV
jgi:acyl CoA:acetate/3-ketoacid CoA transferase